MDAQRRHARFLPTTLNNESRALTRESRANQDLSREEMTDRPAQPAYTAVIYGPCLAIRKDTIE